MSTGFDAVGLLAAHIARTRFEDLSAEAVGRAKTFLLDTIGVGLAGTSDAHAGGIAAIAAQWGAAEEATVWTGGAKLPAPSAALVNAYLVHCLEYDCVHEGAVVHPMATLLSALFAWCEREGGRGRPVDGKRFLTAMAVGVDVAGLLGMSTHSRLRFFRPATAGGFGAAAALASAAGCDEAGVKDVLGLQYSQTSGTMQAHVEGSVALGLQIGFNARAALNALDLAEAGLRGPHDVLTGPFGYFALIENGSFDPEPIGSQLGRVWQIERLSHKPFPSGRLTHGAVDGLRRLMATHDFAPDEIEEATVHVPSLVMRLVARPDVPHPTSNYAKLCLPFVAGTFLARGRVDVPDFGSPETLSDPQVHAHAARVRAVQDDNPNQNAIAPQRVVVRLKSGAEHELTLPAVYGHPDAALTPEENLDKFARCCRYARPAASPELRDRIVAFVDKVETVPDVAALPELLSKRGGP